MLEYILKKLIKISMATGFILMILLSKVKGVECYYKINETPLDGFDVYFRWK